MDRQELRAALQAFGFNVSDTFVSNLIQKFDRYGKEDTLYTKEKSLKGYIGTNVKTQGHGNVSFDNFVQACVTVKTLTDSFRGFDTNQAGWIQINYEQVKGQGEG